MYQAHFGLKQNPFSLTPNTSLYQALQPHQEAMQVLVTALAQGEGFIKVSGEVGTGKTLLCRKLLAELSDDFRFAYLPNPCLSANQIHAALAAELNIELNDNLAEYQLLDRIHHQLIALAKESQPVVLLIDEAQALSDDALEVVRLLGNLETEQRKLLQIVLFGQPELDQRLASEQLRQLRQRITFSYQLRPLNKQEVASYLQHRLHLSGYRSGALFTSSSLALLTSASRGIPRLINVLANKALMLCYGQGLHQVSRSMVKQAVIDTEDARLPQHAKWFSLGVVTSIALVGLLYWEWLK